MDIKIYEPHFEVKGHLYAKPDDGQILDSVTTIIKQECDLYRFGNGAAAERGTAVHMACQFYDDGNLDESTVAENVWPYLEQYKLALEQYKIKVLANELMRYHPVYLYAGTLDKIAMVGPSKGIIDIKTGAECLDHKWQTAAYKDMVKHEHAEDLKRWILYLKTDGFKLVEHTGRRDFQEFLALYTAHNIKVNSGFRKRKTDQEEMYD